MALTVRTGNIFTSTCQTLVNTTNCVGVMGAGIALECRLRWPRMHDRYRELCTAGQIQPGLLWIYKAPDRWILNFPTKRHWRYPTKETYLRAGLQKLLDSWHERGITSIALPLLGADKGGLDPERSLALIQHYLGELPIPVEIYRYDPNAPDDIFQKFHHWLEAVDQPTISERTGVRRATLDAVLSAMQETGVRQLNQLSRVDGVGIKTLEKLFHVATGITEEKEASGQQLQLL